MRGSTSSGGWLWALGLVALGTVLLLDRFLLIPDFSTSALLPLVLVVIGLIVLVRGDLFAGGAGKSFGITRGSVENAAIEISAGAVDVQVYPLQREGRLIAGQYAPDARPALDVQGVEAKLRLDRAATPFFSFTPWQAALARDLPWKVYITTHLGQVSANCEALIIGGAVIATGVGDIHFTAPSEALAPIYLRSALGNVHLTTPPGHAARLIVKPTRLFRVHVDATRYIEESEGVYLARDAAPDRPEAVIYISSTFGDAYLS